MSQDPKATLRRYLDRRLDALLWKLDDLSEYDARRPMTPTATNLLGLVKHVGSVVVGYLGETFDRPFPEPMPWYDEGADDVTSDMWAGPEESRADVLGFFARARAHADATLDALDLDAVGHVPHWPADVNEVTLHTVLVHLLSEVAQHVGHADICRELIDGEVGLNAANTNIPEELDWARVRAVVESAAASAANAAGAPSTPVDGP